MNDSRELDIVTVAIIPVFNEEKTVGNVAKAALEAELIDGVVVVNDGSSDQSSAVAYEALAEVEGRKPFVVMEHCHNKGKTEALKSGVTCAKDLGGTSLRALLFMDADTSPISSRQTIDNQKLGAALVGRLTGKLPIEISGYEAYEEQEIFIKSLAGYMDTMLEPVLDHELVMTIALHHRNRLIDGLRLALSWGALSGNRALSLSLWDSMMREFDERHIEINRWGVEAALNTYTRLRKSPDGIKLNRLIGKQLMPEAVNVGSRKKAQGTLKGLARMAAIHSSAMLSFAKFGVKL